jgi:hypothetical protein
LEGLEADSEGSDYMQKGVPNEVEAVSLSNKQ